MKKIIVFFTFALFLTAGCAAHKQNIRTDEERFVALAKAYNVRDIGGYKTTDGKYVRSGLIYRADELSALSKDDLNKLSTLNIKTYIDFRSKEEEQERPDIKAVSVVKQIRIPVSPGNINDLTELRTDSAKYMMDINKSFVLDFKDEFRQFFEIITDKKNAPVLFHCTAGKDRTGFAAAMILSALGVSRDDIYKDYMLSAEYIKPKFKDMENAEDYGDLLTVKKEYLQAAFDTIESNYGSVEDYLKNELNVDIDKMRKIYTTK